MASEEQIKKLKEKHGLDDMETITKAELLSAIDKLSDDSPLYVLDPYGGCPMRILSVELDHQKLSGQDVALLILEGEGT